MALPTRTPILLVLLALLAPLATADEGECHATPHFMAAGYLFIVECASASVVVCLSPVPEWCDGRTPPTATDVLVPLRLDGLA